jgi:peptidyl-prolyl cis-trans isomerase-like 6
VRARHEVTTVSKGETCGDGFGKFFETKFNDFDWQNRDTPGATPRVTTDKVVVTLAVATVVVTVAGRLDDAAFQQVKKAVEFLAATEPGFVANVVSLLPVDYDLFLQRVLPESFPTVAKHSEPVLTYVGSADTTGGATFVGGLNPSLAWLKGTFRYEDATHSIFYHRLAKMKMRGYVAKTKREYCALEVTKHGEGPIGTLVIELFTDIAPRTCDNFINFVKGTACGAPDDTIPGAVKKYEGCFIHRIVKDGWVQTGDVVCVGGPVGTGITSHFAEGTAFGDETFFVKHDKPGIVSMVRAFPNHHAPPLRLPILVLRRDGSL